jgi:hypothetical protein
MFAGRLIDRPGGHCVTGDLLYCGDRARALRSATLADDLEMTPQFGTGARETPTRLGNKRGRVAGLDRVPA